MSENERSSDSLVPASSDPGHHKKPENPEWLYLFAVSYCSGLAVSTTHPDGMSYWRGLIGSIAFMGIGTVFYFYGGGESAYQTVDRRWRNALLAILLMLIGVIIAVSS